MKAELFFEKLFTEEMYLVPECGNYIYRSVPTKPYGWNVWRKTIGGGKEQPYDWKELKKGMITLNSIRIWYQTIKVESCRQNLLKN